MSEHAIVVTDLVKTFVRRRQPPVRAIDSLTFSVRRGSIFGLLGPNGAGKTTTLRVLTTLIAPTSGSALVMGHDVVREPLEVRRRISVVIQEHAAELFLNVRENLVTFARFHGIPRADIRRRADEVLDAFGLAGEAQRKVMDLSGGFRRRVQVAKMFMVETPIMFLDEFSTGMDPILKRAVMARLRSEAARGRTIVLTTQVLSEAEELCDDILIIDKGREAARGDVHALKLLAEGVYEVALTFEQLPAGLEEAVAALKPLRQSRSGNTLELALKEPESRVLEIVTGLTRLGRALRIEIGGASLEDIFVELTTGRDGRTS